MNKPSLQYQRIKRHVLSGIRSGRWAQGVKIPSENELARKFGLSRMTVNRAIKELAHDGVLNRVRGKGTFVAEPQPLQSVLEIQGIDAEIRARGNGYSGEVLRLKRVKATIWIAKEFNVSAGAYCFVSYMVHRENGVAVQFEKRWVKPAFWPEYLEQDFTQQTPHTYMTSVAPLTRGEHRIEAILPTEETATQLEMEFDEPCLLIRRKTWVNDSVASYVELYHPGTRYQLKTTLKS